MTLKKYILYYKVRNFVIKSNQIVNSVINAFLYYGIFNKQIKILIII